MLGMGCGALGVRQGVRVRGNSRLWLGVRAARLNARVNLAVRGRRGQRSGEVRSGRVICRSNVSETIMAHTLLKCCWKSAHSIQKVPSSLNTTCSSFRARWPRAVSHSAPLSFQGPSHSRMPHGLRSCRKGSVIWQFANPHNGN